MKTHIITETIQIQKQSEIKHFDIRIPEQTEAIIGIQYGIRFQDEIARVDVIPYDEVINDHFIIADLRLQGAKTATWFYASELRDNLLSIKSCSFYEPAQNNNIPFIFHQKHEMEKLNIQPSSTIINGYIKDVIGKTFNEHISYSITISLHVSLSA
jgi:hypothetical protein